MYAQATGLWRSTDSGETWKLVYPKPANIKTIVMRSDHSDENLVADPDPLGAITALAIDPGDAKVFYAAAGGKDHPALFISRDSGQTWQQEGALPETPRRIWVDSRSPRESRTLFIAGQHFVSVKNSSAIRNFPAPDSARLQILRLVSRLRSPSLRGFGKGIYRSKDGRSSWQQSSAGFWRGFAPLQQSSAW
jgi:hypothetical protein